VYEEETWENTGERSQEKIERGGSCFQHAEVNRKIKKRGEKKKEPVFKLEKGGFQNNNNKQPKERAGSITCKEKPLRTPLM